MPRTKKRKISVSIDETLLKWIDDNIKNFEFSSVSNAIEMSIMALKKQKEKEKEG
jgi:Arc/MetJ-type ribon-helix-helix transcriptional regulator